MANNYIDLPTIKEITIINALTLIYDTNYGTVGANTIRTAAQIGNATGAANFGAGSTSAQTLRVVLPTDQTAIPVTQSGSWTVLANQGTSPWVISGTVAATQSGTWNIGTVTTITNPVTVAQATASNLNAQVVGNVASGATDSGNPVKISGKVNTTAPTFTDGQRGDLQQDTTGSVYVNTVSRKASYSSTATFQIAANATDVFTITGSASKTILIKSIAISGTNSNNTNALITLLKRSTANTSGTSTTPTVVPHDSVSAAGTAVTRAYTANPTLGTLVGNIGSTYLFFPLLGSVNVSEQFHYDLSQGVQPLTLRGTDEIVSVNMQAVGITGTTILAIRITWSEE